METFIKLCQISMVTARQQNKQLNIIYQISPPDIRPKTPASRGVGRQQYHGVTFSQPLLPPSSAETQFLTPRRKYLQRRENPPTQPGHYQIRFRNKVEDRWDTGTVFLTDKRERERVMNDSTVAELCVCWFYQAE